MAPVEWMEDRGASSMRFIVLSLILVEVIVAELMAAGLHSGWGSIGGGEL